MAAAVSRVVTDLGGVVQGWTLDILVSVEAAGPTGIMTVWRRSLVIIPNVVAAGLTPLQVGEFTLMLVSASRRSLIACIG